MKNILNIIKSLLVPVGVFLIGKNLLGHTIDESLWQEVLGGAMAVVGFINSFLDHTVTEELLQSFLSQLLKSAMALLTAFGITEGIDTAVWLPLIGLVSQQVYRWISKKKSQGLDSGKILIEDLKK